MNWSHTEEFLLDMTRKKKEKERQNKLSQQSKTNHVKGTRLSLHSLFTRNYARPIDGFRLLFDLLINGTPLGQYATVINP